MIRCAGRGGNVEVKTHVVSVEKQKNHDVHESVHRDTTTKITNKMHCID